MGFEVREWMNGLGNPVAFDKVHGCKCRGVDLLIQHGVLPPCVPE